MINQLKAQLEVYHELDKGFWGEVLDHHKIIQVQKDDIVIRYNSICKDVYFLVQGSVKCSQILEDGGSKAVWFHFDDIFEAVVAPDSFYDEEPTKYEFRALEKSTLIKIKKEWLNHWVATYKCFNYIFVHNIVRDFVSIYEARSCLLSLSSLDFLKYTRRKFPFIFEKLPAYLIADFMGVTPEWYSKLNRKVGENP